jgi:hypothetical protein
LLIGTRFGKAMMQQREGGPRRVWGGGRRRCNKNLAFCCLLWPRRSRLHSLGFSLVKTGGLVG